MLHAVVAYVRELDRHLSSAMARQGGAVRGHRQEDAAPAVHAGFWSFFVVVRGHENQFAGVTFGFKFGPVFIGDAFGAHQLLFGRQQADPVELRPAIKLAGRQLDEVGLKRDAQFDDAVDFVDVVPMGDEVQHHRITVGFDGAGHFELLREGLFRAREQVVHLLVAGLKADLDMVQPGLFEVADFLLSEADARGDQVGVETQCACLANQLGQVLAYQRLAA